MKIATALTILAVAWITPAQAHGRHHHYHPHPSTWTEKYFPAPWNQGEYNYEGSFTNYRRTEARASPPRNAWSYSAAGLGVRPRAWCGWYMRQVTGLHDPALNLARNWARVGRATGPHVGAIVVFQHHVGKIVGEQNGQWIVLSGNDGNRVRTRELSVRRAIAFREI